MAKLECFRVRKEYALGKTSVRALRGVDCAFGSGEFVALMGPSGSGKSTLLNLLGLIDAPTAGEVLFDSVPLSGAKEGTLTRLRGERIGFVFQGFNLIPILTIRENVEFPLSRSELTLKEIRKRSSRLLEETGIAELGGRFPNEVSGGQCQRAAIARALIHEPAFVLADEPTANLDTATGAAIIGLLRDMTREKGSTVILATHDPEIVKLAGRLISLRDGTILSDEGGR